MNARHDWKARVLEQAQKTGAAAHMQDCYICPADWTGSGVKWLAVG